MLIKSISYAYLVYIWSWIRDDIVCWIIRRSLFLWFDAPMLTSKCKNCMAFIKGFAWWLIFFFSKLCRMECHKNCDAKCFFASVGIHQKSYECRTQQRLHLFHCSMLWRCKSESKKWEIFFLQSLHVFLQKVPRIECCAEKWANERMRTQVRLTIIKETPYNSQIEEKHQLPGYNRFLRWAMSIPFNWIILSSRLHT